MQNKKANIGLWILLVIALIVAGYLFLSDSNDTIKPEADTIDLGVNLDDAEDLSFENIETTDEILNEIDNSLDFLF